MRQPKPAIRDCHSTPVAISLTDAEIACMEPYLQQATSATRAYEMAHAALAAIAQTIAGRVGVDPTQKFKLDLAGKRLIPLP